MVVSQTEKNNIYQDNVVYVVKKEGSCLMGMNTVFITRHTLTSAPITPKLVSLRYSKGFDLLDVFKKAYRYSGI